MKIGDRVTCRFAESAYYSRYNGSPEVLFEPGMVGVVSAIAPKVRITRGPGKDGKPDFLVVDFDSPTSGKRERVGLNFDNAIKLPNLSLIA